MTAKEKAEQLVNKFRPFATSENGRWDASTYNSKNCAKIAVEELIKEASKTITTIRYKGCNLSDYEYWNEVLTEIDKL